MVGDGGLWVRRKEAGPDGSPLLRRRVIVWVFGKQQAGHALLRLFIREKTDLPVEQSKACLSGREQTNVRDG